MQNPDEIILAQQARIEQLLEAVEYCCSQVQEFITVPGISKALSTPDDLSALRAHDAKLLAPYQWQPIETAPKDGTRMLIFMPEASRQKVLEANWATPWDGAPDEQCWWSTPHGPAGRGYTILPKSVTHWMPLPSTEAIEKGKP